MAKKWMQHAFEAHTKGALHKQMGIPQAEKIPTQKLIKIKNTEIGKQAFGLKVTPLLKQRAVLALNARRSKH